MVFAQNDMLSAIASMVMSLANKFEFYFIKKIIN